MKGLCAKCKHNLIAMQVHILLVAVKRKSSVSGRPAQINNAYPMIPVISSTTLKSSDNHITHFIEYLFHSYRV